MISALGVKGTKSFQGTSYTSQQLDKFSLSIVLRPDIKHILETSLRLNNSVDGDTGMTQVFLNPIFVMFSFKDIIESFTRIGVDGWGAGGSPGSLWVC